MKVELHPSAEDELFEGAAWYDDREHGLGVTFYDEVARWIDAIAESPAMWPVVPGSKSTPPIRRVVIRTFPYAVIYQAFPDLIWVLAIAHTRRRPHYWSSRV